MARVNRANLDLPLKIVKAEYSFDGTRDVSLLRGLKESKRWTRSRCGQRWAVGFNARVELRLIGPRDVAKVSAASARAATCAAVPLPHRVQSGFGEDGQGAGISLNPADITGMCGRLRCCLIYEYEQYVKARKSCPSATRKSARRTAKAQSWTSCR